MAETERESSACSGCSGKQEVQLPEQAARRSFLNKCIGAMSALAAAIVVFPVISFMRLPKRLGGAKIIEVLIADLSEDQALYFDRQGVQIVLVYTNKEPKVFDAACTHLGCLVSWDQNKHVFICPCHGAIFDDAGGVVSGPINEPLKEIKFEIKENKIFIG
jgi:cytochrome b6-f complex iron-sulfur subunit